MNNIVQVQFLRGNTTQNDVYLGRPGQITVDETTNKLRLHDGVTVGGFPIPGDVFPYIGAAIITGSLSVSGSAVTTRYDNGVIPSIFTVNWEISNHQSITLGTNSALTYSGAQPGGVYSLEVRFTGAVSASWPPDTRWPDNGGGEPIQSSLNNRMDIYTFYNDGTVYNGQVFGYNYSVT